MTIEKEVGKSKVAKKKKATNVTDVINSVINEKHQIDLKVLNEKLIVKKKKATNTTDVINEKTLNIIKSRIYDKPDNLKKNQNSKITVNKNNPIVDDASTVFIANSKRGFVKSKTWIGRVILWIGIKLGVVNKRKSFLNELRNVR